MATGYVTFPNAAFDSIFSGEEFARDAVALLKVPEDALQQALASDGAVFLSLPALIERLRAIAEGDQERALVNAATIIASLRRNVAISQETFNTRLRNAVIQGLEGSDLTPEAVDAVSRRLVVLGTPTEAIRRQWKAEDLSTEVGYLLHDFRVLTDIRPVYDDERSKIEGFVLVATAVVQLNGPNQESKELAVHLDSRDLASIGEQIERAQRKLREARSYLERSGSKVADTGGDD